MVSLSFVHNGEGGGGGERGCIGWSMPWKERHGVGDGSEFAWLGSGSIFLSCSTFFSRFLSLMVLEGLLLGGGSSRLG